MAKVPKVDNSVFPVVHGQLVGLSRGKQKKIMPNQEVKRKLAAILNSDVEGHTRLMSEDEVVTICTLNAMTETRFYIS
jgi:hypothetical protein